MIKRTEKEWQLEEKEFWDEKYRKDAESEIKTSLNRKITHEKFFFHFMRAQIDGKVLLEVGSGNSSLISELCNPAMHNFDYIATDISMAGLQIGQRLLFKNANFIQCDVTNMPFKDEIFDIILCLGVLHHIPGHESNLESLFNLLKNRGYFLLYEPLERVGIIGRMFRKLLRIFEKESQHEDRIKRNALIEICQKNGRILFCGIDYSPVRAFLVFLLRNTMEKSRIAKMVILIDELTIKTLGRLFSVFSGGGCYLIVQKGDVIHERL